MSRPQRRGAQAAPETTKNDTPTKRTTTAPFSTRARTHAHGALGRVHARRPVDLVPAHNAAVQDALQRELATVLSAPGTLALWAYGKRFEG